MFVAVAGVTETATETHVFDVVAGPLNAMSVNEVPLIVVAAIAVTVRSRVPGPASCTTNVHMPPLVPPVRHVDAGSSVPSPVVDAVRVVPFATAFQSAGVG